MRPPFCTIAASSYIWQVTLLLIILFAALWADDIAQLHVESNFAIPAKGFYRFWTWHKAIVLGVVGLTAGFMVLVAWGVSHAVFQVQVNRRRNLPWWNMSDSPGDKTVPDWDHFMLKLAGGREKVAAIISITLGALAALAGGGAYILLG